jgi:hypothetical protein
MDEHTEIRLTRRGEKVPVREVLTTEIPDLQKWIEQCPVSSPEAPKQKTHFWKGFLTGAGVCILVAIECRSLSVNADFETGELTLSIPTWGIFSDRYPLEWRRHKDSEGWYFLKDGKWKALWIEDDAVHAQD